MVPVSLPARLSICFLSTDPPSSLTIFRPDEGRLRWQKLREQVRSRDPAHRRRRQSPRLGRRVKDILSQIVMDSPGGLAQRGLLFSYTLDLFSLEDEICGPVELDIPSCSEEG